MFKRQDFANFAATIGIERPAQAIAVPLRKQRGVGLQIAQIFKAQLLAQLLFIGNRFRKMLSGIEEQHRHAGVYACD